ncbi:FAD-dependent oxidoreductase [Microlunatus panaciterrae]|uniref:Assimilatory nitrate reductase electron transfer subunit n=1 Tax=Microlunatus panaciterrae TaxID=400768 RepID=A0ABS2RHM8_9ACTN|nr:FAD-dependent oxidoreductase [Microlunatus panaciterrae]MBM7798057.1 assimilatory nitrate reductase electron transfer subunit [Microlunatus panaciterrae]
MTTRIVVVGHGMVGSRFVEDLLRRDHDRQYDITVLGAEGYEPYNRVLLSDVVAGRVEVTGLVLPGAADERVRVLRGVGARRIDRRARLVVASDGSRHAYDRLVLATGSRARIPDLPGLERPGDPTAGDLPGLPAGIHPLRTLDDAREIVAATVNAGIAVVLGAGVLGLEVACGLARRGLQVTVIHGNPTPMDRQLDTGAGQTVAASLTGMGIQQRMSAKIDEVLVSDGRLAGIRLVGGEQVPAELLVLACGTEPETRLAADAGLAVGRGVIVSEALSSPTDDNVFAIGDCAQPPEGSSGLIAQGWDQARQLAARLTRTAHATSAAAPRNDVVRVKAHGLEVVAMGVCGERRVNDPTHRTLRLSDPDQGRHLEVVVAGGLLVGATCVGSPAVGADLVSAFTRGTPVPADPAQLLIRSLAPAATPATSPTHIPDRATICNCNGVRKKDIVSAWRSGARAVSEVACATRATTGCGTCTNAVCGIVDWLASVDPQPDESPSHPRSERGEQGVTPGKHHLHTAEITAG